MQTWTDAIDPSTIPDGILFSEYGRRRARLRKTYTGGVVWKKHNATAANCRCRRCMDRRAKENA